MAALLYPEGTKDVELGKLVAILVEDEKDIAAFADYQVGSDSSSSAAPVQTQAAP